MQRPELFELHRFSGQHFLLMLSPAARGLTCRVERCFPGNHFDDLIVATDDKMVRFTQKMDITLAEFLDPGGIEYLKKAARMGELFEDVPGTFLGRDPKGLDRGKGH
jgi:hypothetical protein